MQDRATLRSDPSGIQGYTGAALSVLLYDKLSFTVEGEPI